MYTLQQAAEEVILVKLPKLEGEGGLIAVDAQGTPVMSFNSAGMYRAYRSSDGNRATAIYETLT